MDYNKPLDLLHLAKEAVWVKKINTARGDGSICSWASSFHPERLPCRLDGGFMNGSYNVGQRIVFDEGTTWFLRLPRASSVSPEYADEKVAMEVGALLLIQEKTSIPVPEIHAWGLAGKTRLGGDSRLLKQEISDADIEYVYRQMAHFMLQLFKLDLKHIGDLPTPKTRFPAPSRPLTWKGHEILRLGGVKTFDDSVHGFSSTMQYFGYVNSQDERQLRLQPNSIAGPRSAKSRYSALNVLKSLIPELTHTTYDCGPFKLIWDDFGLANVIVRGKDDLTITGVVDLEWVYAGPAQLFGSAPWWLLLERPVNDEWDFEQVEAPKATGRYFRCLEIFIRVLEEEARMSGNGQRELTELVKWSRDTGAMWLHMLLSSGFFDTLTFPCMQLRKHKGEQWWDERINDLAAYDVVRDKVDHYKALIDSGEMTAEDFISTYPLFSDLMWHGSDTTAKG
ncbi:phosphotransferase enzyme family protein [Aspergillus desertorum]